MDRDTMVNYRDGGNGRRVPREVEVFDPAAFENRFSEADDMNKPSSEDLVDGNFENDLNVNFTMAERGNKRIPRDVEVFNPEELSDETRREEYTDPKVHDVEEIDESWNNEGINLENDTRVNERLESRTRVPRDVEVFDPANL